jgi:hypothetical protein
MAAMPVRLLAPHVPAVLAGLPVFPLALITSAPRGGSLRRGARRGGARDGAHRVVPAMSRS